MQRINRSSRQRIICGKEELEDFLRPITTVQQKGNHPREEPVDVPIILVEKPRGNVTNAVDLDVQQRTVIQQVEGTAFDHAHGLSGGADRQQWLARRHTINGLL